MEKKYTMKDMQNALNTGMARINENPTALAVNSSGRPRPLDAACERTIYGSTFPNIGEISVINFDGYAYHEPIETYLISSNSWHLTHSNQSISLEDSKKKIIKQIWLHPEGYMLSLTCDFEAAERSLETLAILVSEEKKDDKVCIIENADFYYPTAVNTEAHEEILQDLLQNFSKNYVKETKESSIYIISQDGRDYYAKRFSLEGHVPPAIHMNEHYGDGFTDFYEQLLERIKVESKGLVLFHGEPGTGKTQFIRMLLDELTRHKKSILYAPPSLSAQLTEPHMIEFISNWVMDEDNDCILLIEDAEPLLEIRNGLDGRSTGISNLLNITDGILNDMLGLMVIATFNTSISKIDSALLRPQRLIARKEFGKLSLRRGQALAKALEIENPLAINDYPATLAEFYSAKKKTQILVHEITEERKIGFKS